MKTFENRDFKMEFEARLLQKQQALVYARPQYFTQRDVAEMAGVSLRKIQLFESFKQTCPYLIYVYNCVLN